MGKKKLRSSQTSKGECGNISKWSIKAVKAGVAEVDKILNKWQAWKAGKNVWVTVPNPDPKNTKARWIRVKASEVWGNPKDTHNPMKDWGRVSGT